MTEDGEYLAALTASRQKIADAVQEFINLKAEASVTEEGHDHYGMAPHGHMLSDCVIAYQSVCLAREDGKPGYALSYASVTDGTLASDIGVCRIAFRQMECDLLD